MGTWGSNFELFYFLTWPTLTVHSFISWHFWGNPFFFIFLNFQIRLKRRKGAIIEIFIAILSWPNLTRLKSWWTVFEGLTYPVPGYVKRGYNLIHINKKVSRHFKNLKFGLFPIWQILARSCYSRKRYNISEIFITF